MHGGVHTDRCCSVKLFEAPAAPWLVLGLVPRLEGGVDALQGIGRGGVLITSTTDSSVASLSAVVEVTVAGVVLVRDMVTVVVVIGFLFCCRVTIFGSNNARRCATVKVVGVRFGECF